MGALKRLWDKGYGTMDYWNPCPVHDAPSPRRIAQLEVDTGIDPDAVAKHEASAASFVEAFANPDLIDCGRPRCKTRRR